MSSTTRSKGYLIEYGGKLFGDSSLRRFLDVLKDSGVEEGYVFFKNFALYFKRCDEYCVLISGEKCSVGATKFYEREIVKRVKIKNKFNSLDDVFKLAEEIEDMDFDEFVRRVMR